MNTPVSFEIAKLLKEKEFDKSTEANWWILAKDHSENYNKKLPVDESKIFFTENSYELEMATQIDEDTEHNVYHVLSAPTIADVVMWLYETHKIWISVDPNNDTDTWFYTISHNKSETVFGNYSGGPIEAYEKGIEHVLNNMI